MSHSTIKDQRDWLHVRARETETKTFELERLKEGGNKDKNENSEEAEVDWRDWSVFA